jgi:hypothetical protein
MLLLVLLGKNELRDSTSQLQIHRNNLKPSSVPGGRLFSLVDIRLKQQKIRSPYHVIGWITTQS